MKRKLVVEVDCEEKLCGECNHRFYDADIEDYDLQCELFGAYIKDGLERCPACLDAETLDDRTELLHLVEQQSKELAALREENRWRDPAKEPPEDYVHVLVYLRKQYSPRVVTGSSYNFGHAWRLDGFAEHADLGDIVAWRPLPKPEGVGK